MRIERQSYVDRLEERRENGSIKIVTGIRRCGKTYLLFDLYAARLRETGVAQAESCRSLLTMMPTPSFEIQAH